MYFEEGWSVFGKKNGKVESLLYSGDREKILAMVREMGSMASEAFRLAVQSLEERDDALAERVIEEDDAIDDLEATIDHECLCSIAMRQPVREDLRFVFAVLKIITDLERVGDQAVNIAKRAKALNRYPLLKPLIDIPKLADLSQRMVKDAIDAFVHRDTDLAKSVILRDAEADDLRNLVQSELINDFMTKDPSTAPRAVPLLLVARHLERICDHATNIAEDVIKARKAAGKIPER